MLGYLFTFMGGSMFGGLCGVIIMCLMQISGEESRREEKYEFERQGQSANAESK